MTTPLLLFHNCLTSPLRFIATALVSFLLANTFVFIPPASAEEQNTPLVGSFTVAGGIKGGVDERSGSFGVEVPLTQLPGVTGGGTQVGVSYHQDDAGAGENRFGLGAGWVWSGVSFITVDNGVWVHPATGGTFHADASYPSGLQNYVPTDVVFHQQEGVLETGPSASRITYQFFLTHPGGTDYFNSTGDIIARVGVFGEQTVWEWDPGHQLKNVTDNAGTRLTVRWSENTVTLISAPRSDEVVAETVVEINAQHLVSVTDPATEHTTFQYQPDGLLSWVSSTHVTTHLSYQRLPTVQGDILAVEHVKMVDSQTGAELSFREWKPVGEHNASGFPGYTGQNKLWESGDGQYRYRTQLSDGATRVVSEYNSLGLLLTRQVIMSTGAGDVVAQDYTFVFEGTETGGVPSPGTLNPNFGKPITTNVVFSDPVGHSRTVTEHTQYDQSGQMTQHVAADGSITHTVYDSYIPEGRDVSYGLLCEQTVTGADGTVAKTVNTLSSDHKTIQATETFTGTNEKLVRTSLEEYMVDKDGFVFEQRVFPTNETPQQPSPTTTRFSKEFDSANKTFTTRQTHNVNTATEATTSVTVDTVTGLPIKTVDETGRTVTNVYDVAGREVLSTDPAGRTTVTVYDSGVTRVTNPAGVTVSEYVDALGRVIKTGDNVTMVDGAPAVVPGFERVTGTRRYEKNSSRIVVTDVYGVETVATSDMFGRPTQVDGPKGMKQLTQYDDVNNTVTTGIVSREGFSVSDALRVRTTHKDTNNRDVSITLKRRDGVRVPEKSTVYDGLGRVASHTSGDLSVNTVMNPDGTAKTQTLTPTFVNQFPGQKVVADRQYDAFGASVKKTLTTGEGDVREKREGVTENFDPLSGVVTETNQVGQTTTLDSTVDGLVSVVRNDVTGVVTRNFYDPATRQLVLTDTTDSGGVTVSRAFEYDPVTGNVLKVCDPSNCDGTAIGYTYDVLGNTTQVIYPDGRKVYDRFDENSRKISSTDIEGNITNYGYDRYGLLTWVTQKNCEGTQLAHVFYTYDSYGRLSELRRDNNVVSRYTYTSADEVETETTTHDGHVLVDASYEYDSHGNLVRRVDTRPSGDVTGLVSETTVYSYNAYNQLIKSCLYAGGVVAGEPVRVTTYVVGVGGNVTHESTTTLDGTREREFEFNALGQTTAVITDGVRVEQTYDAAGNLTHALDGSQYTYNSVNQPVTVTGSDGTVTKYTYWADGQRHQTRTMDVLGGGEVVGFYWDGTVLVNDTHAGLGDGEAVTGSYLVGVSRHTRTVGGDAGSTQYYVTDRHSNTTCLTSSVGDVVAAYEYTDYGVTTIHTGGGGGVEEGGGNPFQYAGEYTTSLGTQFLGGRVYVPELMGFMTRDSAELFSLYAYAGGNPIVMVDPSGRAPNFDSVVSGLIFGVSVLAAVTSSVLLIASSVFYAEAMSWVSFGVSAGCCGADVGAGFIAGVQVVNDQVGVKDFIGPDVGRVLSYVSGVLGLFSGGAVGFGGYAHTEAAAAKAEIEAAATKAEAEANGVLRERKNIALLFAAVNDRSLEKRWDESILKSSIHPPVPWMQDLTNLLPRQRSKALLEMQKNFGKVYAAVVLKPQPRVIIGGGYLSEKILKNSGGIEDVSVNNVRSGIVKSIEKGSNGACEVRWQKLDKGPQTLSPEFEIFVDGTFAFDNDLIHAVLTTKN